MKTPNTADASWLANQRAARYIHEQRKQVVSETKTREITADNESQLQQAVLMAQERLRTRMKENQKEREEELAAAYENKLKAGMGSDCSQD